MNILKASVLLFLFICYEQIVMVFAPAPTIVVPTVNNYQGIHSLNTPIEGEYKKVKKSNNFIVALTTFGNLLIFNSNTY
jgi:hypothetical protein